MDEEDEVNWWKTPPEPPDLNPIENLWHELKEFICKEVKPKTKKKPILGLLGYVDKDKCIRHLRKVIPKVIEVGGQATGY